MGFPAILTGIGGVLYAIWDFFKDYIKRKWASMPGFLFMIGLNAVVLPIFLLYFYSLVKLLLFLKEQFNNFLLFFETHSVNSEILNLLNDVIRSLRFYDALKSALDLYYPFISVMLLGVVYKITLNAYIFVRDQIVAFCIARL